MEEEKKEPRYIRGKYTQAAKEATKRYQAKAYDDIKIRVPKGDKAVLQEFAANHGYSLNALFTDAVYMLMSQIEEEEANENNSEE